jgi:hypothetical protein
MPIMGLLCLYLLPYCLASIKKCTSVLEAPVPLAPSNKVEITDSRENLHLNVDPESL